MNETLLYPRSLTHAFGVTLCVVLTILAPISSVHAELGGTMTGAQPAPAGSAPDDAPVVLLNGAVLKRTSVDAGGTTINEYASNSGQIFAYTWQGPTMPDLPSLLGPFNASYRAGASAAAADSPDLHASHVTRPDVVVDSGGQMRSYVGRAWLPAALPAGVTPDALN